MVSPEPVSLVLLVPISLAPLLWHLHGPHPGEGDWHFYRFIFIPTCHGVLADGLVLI